VWRQHAFATVHARHAAVGGGGGKGAAEGTGSSKEAQAQLQRELGQCMDAFRERVAYVVENAVPAARLLTDRLTAALAEHQVRICAQYIASRQT